MDDPDEGRLELFLEWDLDQKPAIANKGDKEPQDLAKISPFLVCRSIERLRQDVLSVSKFDDQDFIESSLHGSGHLGIVCLIVFTPIGQGPDDPVGPNAKEKDDQSRDEPS